MKLRRDMLAAASLPWVEDYITGEYGLKNDYDLLADLLKSDGSFPGRLKGVYINLSVKQGGRTERRRRKFSLLLSVKC